MKTMISWLVLILLIVAALTACKKPDDKITECGTIFRLNVTQIPFTVDVRLDTEDGRRVYFHDLDYIPGEKGDFVCIEQ